MYSTKSIGPRIEPSRTLALTGYSAALHWEKRK